MVLLYVAIGGALGSALRYLAGGTIQRVMHAGFPGGLTTFSSFTSETLGLAQSR